MTGIRARILGAVTALLTGVGPAAAQQSTPFSDMQQDAIHALILDTIRENPEVIIDSIMAYQDQVAAETEKRRRAAIADLRSELQSDQNAASLGNPDGGTVIVEFFDYNCPYCRRAAPEVNALIDEDPICGLSCESFRSSGRIPRPPPVRLSQRGLRENTLSFMML